MFRKTTFLSFHSFRQIDCFTGLRPLSRFLLSATLFAASGLVLPGCVMTPDALRSGLHESPSIAAVRAEPLEHAAEPITWGGSVVSVENLKDHTLLQVVARDLNRYGRPSMYHHSHGRFIARVEGFLDPEVYQQNREVTVVGKLDGTMSQKIGEADYVFPVLAVEAHHLWGPQNTHYARRGFRGYYGYAGERRPYSRRHLGYGHPFFDWWGFNFGYHDRSHRSHFSLDWSFSR